MDSFGPSNDCNRKGNDDAAVAAVIRVKDSSTSGKPADCEPKARSRTLEMFALAGLLDRLVSYQFERLVCEKRYVSNHALVLLHVGQSISSRLQFCNEMRTYHSISISLSHNHPNDDRIMTKHVSVRRRNWSFLGLFILQHFFARADGLASVLERGATGTKAGCTSGRLHHSTQTAPPLADRSGSTTASIRVAPVSPTSTASSVPSTQSIEHWSQESYGISKVKAKAAQKETEYKWLTWLYRNWKYVPVGELDEGIVRLMVPAMPLYAKRRTRRAAEQAEEMLDRYIAEYEAGNKAAELNNTLFHAVMDAHAKCGQPEQAAAVLQKMIHLSKREELLQALEPDVFSFTILATAWAKSRHPQAADKAENLLHYMERQNMAISTLTYNVVLNAIAVCHDKAKASRARRLVHRMEQMSQNKEANCEPDLYTYQSWMAACSRTRVGLDETMQIFHSLEEKAGERPHLRPNAHCFAAAIHAWAYSSKPNKAHEAHRLLQEMKRRYEDLGQSFCRPNVVVFTSVINACVNPSSEHEALAAFDIAQSTFEELLCSPYGPPNFLTYAALLHACSTCLPRGEYCDSVVDQIFDMCCEYGCVGRIVVQKFREAASAELQDDVLGTRDWNDLPSDWTRRVKGERFNGKQHSFVKAATQEPNGSHSSSSNNDSQPYKRDMDHTPSSEKSNSFGSQDGIQWTAKF